jgi:predicted nucleotidyltransferase
MNQYTSIKDDAVKKLEEHLPELQRRFGIESVGIFGSVSRGEDTEDSDIDFLYIFQENRGNLNDYAGAAEYLEKLLGREIDFVSLEFMNPNLRPYVEKDMILFGGGKAEV